MKFALFPEETPLTLSAGLGCRWGACGTAGAGQATWLADLARDELGSMLERRTGDKDLSDLKAKL